MLAQDRLAQTLLFAGPEGVGKATLARRLGARLLPEPAAIERDDLSLPEQPGNRRRARKMARREAQRRPAAVRQPSRLRDLRARRAAAPDHHPADALLKERAQFLPLKGRRRIFLIDHVDRANEQAANSLLKTLEEPPEHLILIMTAENAYDLLPTIRSRAVPFHFAPLAREEMERSSRRAAWTGRSAASRWRRAAPAWRFRSIWTLTTSAAPPCWRC